MGLNACRLIIVINIGFKDFAGSCVDFVLIFRTAVLKLDFVHHDAVVAVKLGAQAADLRFREPRVIQRDGLRLGFAM